MESSDLNIIMAKAMDLCCFYGNKSGCVPLTEYEALLYEKAARMLEAYMTKVRKALEEGEPDG